jgi:hypothetical protein
MSWGIGSVRIRGEVATWLAKRPGYSPLEASTLMHLAGVFNVKPGKQDA